MVEIQLSIFTDIKELEKFAGKSLTGGELDRLIKKLPNAIWDQIGEDGWEALIQGILEE